MVSILIFLGGAVMIGRGIDQILPQPCAPGLHGSVVRSATEYVHLAHLIPADQRWFACKLIDEGGVSVVHGHSSHSAKAVAIYDARAILYGCGDLVQASWRCTS